MYRAGIRELRNNTGRYASINYARACNILREISRSYIGLYGPDEFVAGLAEPYFTDFLLIPTGLDELGGDSTLVLSAVLKESVSYRDGVAVLGGKFLSRFNIPKELPVAAAQFGLPPGKVEQLAYCSRMAAKIDSVAIQDGFDLYFHMMVLSMSGVWTIIQQSQNSLTQTVRRYHWFSGYLRNFVEEPHTGIISQERKPIVLDMTARESSGCRKTSVEIIKMDLPKLQRLRDYIHLDKQTRLTGEGEKERVEFLMPRGNINWLLLSRLRENPPQDFEKMLAIQGVGREIVKLLALGSMVYYDISPSFRDPAYLVDELPRYYDEAVVLSRLQQLVDSIRESRLNPELKRHCLARLADNFGASEGVGLAG
ncbi:MAG: DUF763 domain-containing protein [Nitrososphaerota archaeon]